MARRRTRRSARSTPVSRRSIRPRPVSPRCPVRASTSSPTTPSQARELLVDAYQQLDVAEEAKVKATTIAPLRKQVEAGLDRLYGVVPVASTTRFTFKPAEGANPIDLRGLVRGPDGAPYVIDRSTRSVYRIDLKNKKATLVARFGQKASGGTVASPRFIGLGATSDLLILDSKNVLWRWRPADATGKGTLVKIDVNGSSSWGDDIRGFGTYLRDEARNLYNLYVVDPSEQQILAYSPSADGGGFPGAGSPWLATARDVSELSSIYIDGDLFAATAGELVRFVSGKSDGWDASAPDDTLLRPAPGLLAGRRWPRHRPADRLDLRLRQAERPDRRHRQDRRHVQGPVPAGRRRRGLGRPARVLRGPGRGRRAGPTRLDLQRRAAPVEPGGDPRRRPVGLAIRVTRGVGQPGRVRQAVRQAVSRTLTPGSRSR